MKFETMLSWLKNKEIRFSLISGLCLLSGFVLSFLPGQSLISLLLYVVAYAFGSYFILGNIIAAIRKLHFDIDLLMFAAAIGAAILGQWEEGALLLFLFSLGHALEAHAMQKANHSLAGLAELAPQTALLKTGNDIAEVPVADLKPGDLIVVKPDSKIAADGIVVKGSSSVNQSSITGESIPADKFALASFEMSDLHSIEQQYKIYSGTINGQGYLEAIVSKKAKDSTLSKLISLVHEAKKQHSNTQKFTHNFEKSFVPIVLAFVFVLNFAFLVLDETFAESFYRAISVLVVSSPCALVISTPSAVLSGIARAARKGILIKGGRPLEDLAQIKAIAFDKTGTLTKGKPTITKIISVNGYSPSQLLELVVSVEMQSDHPLAKAIVKEAGDVANRVKTVKVENFKSITGKGVTACISGEEITIGNLEMFENDKSIPASVISNVLRLENEGNTCMIIRKGNIYRGIIGLMDTPREETSGVIDNLKNLGIKKILLLSGDNQRVAESVGRSVGIEEVLGNLLPEDKVNAILSLKTKQKVAMVGDGVNDAPAMANSTVGIAMGAAGSDIAMETADIALMSDKLGLLTFAINISRATRRIIVQNLFISLGVIAIMIPLTLFGIASIGPAVLIHEGSTVLVVFNALRLLKFEEKHYLPTAAVSCATASSTELTGSWQTR